MSDKLNASISDLETMTYEAPEVLELGGADELVNGSWRGNRCECPVFWYWC